MRGSDTGFEDSAFLAFASRYLVIQVVREGVGVRLLHLSALQVGFVHWVHLF
jgi:hypothetical protein